MKTIDEFREAMMDVTMQQEFKAFLEEKHPETREDAAKAMMEFVASREVKKANGKKELSLDDLENVAGGKELRSEDFENVFGGYFETDNVKKMFEIYAPVLHPFVVALYDGIDSMKNKKEAEFQNNAIAENFANC